ncbi:MAG TPA: ABC transporter permease [Candidatus Bathyarchaeia archaeon]|nr:ABC transporter permease [Candidatus Bathyarchaeia archaeon]
MHFGRDVRFSFRLFRKDLGLTLTVILILSVGIGATTAVFTVANALLLRPFPYRDPQQLVSLQVKDSTKDYDGTLLRYELLRDRAQSFESVAAWANDTFNLTGHGEPAQVAVGRVSPNFFAVLGVQPRIGRSFAEEEGRPEGKPVVILSDALWRSRYGGDPSIVGQTIALDGTLHTVAGILPANVQFPFVGEADVWTPRYFELTLIPPQKLRQGVGYLGFIARLRPATSLTRADAELGVLNRQYREQNPTAPDAGPDISMTAAPLRDMVVANVHSKLWILFGAVALVLLIACGNVASLLLSRGLARRKEIAVRTALGANRGEVLRQLLTESTMLAMLACVAGIALGWIATRALVAWGPSQLPQGMPVGMDLWVLLFTVLLSLLTGIGFGIFPALQLARVDLQTTLRQEGRGASGGHARTRISGSLVVGQVALSLVLLIAAGLLLRSYARLLRVDPGFDAHNVLTMNLSLPTVKYAKPAQQVDFFNEVVRRISEVPGVRSAAISATLPLTWKRITPMLPEGQPNVPLGQRPFIDIEAVSPQWFQVMRVPVRGREFTEADNADAPKVLVVNETFARQFWPGQDAVGKHVVVGRWPQPAEVIGVAQDVRNKGLAQAPQPQVYIPFPQLPWSDMNLLVRTAVPPQTLVSAIRAQIAAVDPDQPITSVQSVDDLMDSSRTQPRFLMLLLTAFSITALALAVVGIYGVLAYSVAQRWQELGIRMALGAERSDILRLVVRQGVMLAMFGVALGLVAALLMTRLMSSVLYKVGSHDLMTFALAPVLFLAVAVLTSYIPARRATTVDPTVALRQQ